VPIAPKCPLWIKGEARKEWKRVVPMLDALGVLTEMDVTAFEIYCRTYAQWKYAEEQLNKEGLTITTPNGHKQTSPYVSIANQCKKIMRNYLAAFGMTPVDRARKSVAPKDEDDEFASLLSR